MARSKLGRQKAPRHSPTCRHAPRRLHVLKGIIEMHGQLELQLHLHANMLVGLHQLCRMSPNRPVHRTFNPECVQQHVEVCDAMRWESRAED